ncbi:anti-sigma regulatory factor (Ser/Thr protein kinase) [Actinomadura rupiterrae]|nr:anti-sigma regulatory factor (Ser/Thr protein kinase) [Actinomadura rupiterrae]
MLREHPALDDCVLLASETFTNAVLHGGGDKVEVSVDVQERSVVVAVTDGGSGMLPHVVDEPCALGGRGLFIVQALAREWGFDVLDGGGVRVWFSR